MKKADKTTITILEKQEIMLTEEKLQEQYDFINNILNSTPNPSIFKDKNSIYLAVNKAFCEFMGKNAEEIIGKTDYDLFPAADAEKYVLADKTVMSSADQQEEWQIIGKNGPQWFKVEQTAVSNDIGECIGVLYSMTDISTIKRKEELLRESEARWRSIARYSSDSILTIDLDHCVLFTNHTIQGIPVEEMIGQPIYHFIPEKFHKSAKQCFENVKKTSQPDRYYTDYINSDGDNCYLEARVSPLITCGEIVGFTINGIDITEQKQTADELKNRLELMKLASELSSTFIAAPLSQIDDEINFALQKVAQAGGASRSSLFLLSDDLTTITNTHEWCANPADSQIKLLQDIPFEMFGYHEKQLRNHETIVISTIEDYPLEAKDELEWIKKHGFRAMLFISLLNKGKLYGTLGFYGEIDKEIAWPAFYIEFLKVIGDVFVATLERKKAVKYLQDSEQQYKDLVENMGEGMAILENQKLTFVNESFCRMLGYSKDELLGREILTLFDEENKKKIKTQLAKRKRGELNSYEIEFIAKNGSKVYTIVSPQSIHFDGTIFKGRSAVFTDISARKQMEKLLEKNSYELNERIKQLDCLLSISNLVENKNLSIEHVIQHIVELIPPAWKYPEITWVRVSLEGKEYKTNNFKETKSQFSYPILVNNEKIGVIEVGCINENHEHNKKFAFKGESKLLSSIAKQLGNYIEHKKTFNKLEETNTELKQTQSQMVQQEKLASIGQLAAGIAHELNNPLGFVSNNFITLNNYLKNITTYLKYIDEFISTTKEIDNTQIFESIKGIEQFKKKKKINFILDDVDDLFEESNKGYDRMQGIVKTLKNFAKIDLKNESQNYNINTAINDTLIIASNQIKYVAEIKKQFAEIPTICCNEGEINQVLLNIIVNAAQAIESQENAEMGEICIKTDQNDNYVICEISDNGPGIPKKNIKKIFDSFFTTKEAGKGTGLGLNISYDIIVNKHKGELSVKSEVGTGTSFIIKLPKQKPEDDEE